MSRSRLVILGAALVIAVTHGGCGAITPVGLALKGATWLAEQGVKKEIKHYREQKQDERSGKASDHDDAENHGNHQKDHD